MRVRPVLAFLAAGTLSFFAIGCTEEQQAGAPEATTNEIEAYLNANPDARERPEDMEGENEDVQFEDSGA